MFTAYLHVTIDPKPSFPEDNFYSTPIRPATHVPIHGGAIPIQQPPQVNIIDLALKSY